MRPCAVFDVQAQALECRNCGALYPLIWPMELRLASDLFIGFARDHEKCSEEYAIWKRDPQASGEGTI